MDPRKHRDLEFAYGSGQINPVAAQDPGLVFDASEADYINFLCKQGYNTTSLRLVTGDNSTCASTTAGRAWDLNYPSFSLYVEDGDKVDAVFTRMVTNVGDPNSTYTSSLYMPSPLINVTVSPPVLTFSSVGEVQNFTVTVVGPTISQQPIISGAIAWTDGKRAVRAPLVVYNYLPGAPYNLDSGDQAGAGATPGKLPFRNSRSGKVGQVKPHPRF